MEYKKRIANTDFLYGVQGTEYMHRVQRHYGVQRIVANTV